ncbi:hypothetical protein TNCV_1254541 [Trichonephila clavipes]|nr:hypothetical protein TNCV_1254541 [Trichonephila clavipes]
MRLTDPLINGRKKLFSPQSLGEAKKSVFQEETVLSQATCFQWDNGTDIDEVGQRCLFGQLVRSIIADIFAMPPNINIGNDRADQLARGNLPRYEPFDVCAIVPLEAFSSRKNCFPSLLETIIAKPL